MNPRPPSLLVDARGRQDGFKGHKNRGIGQYARRLLEGLKAASDRFDLSLLVDRSLPLDPIHEGVPLVSYRSLAHSRSFRFFEPQARLPRVIHRAAPALTHFLAHDDAAFRVRTPYVVTVHDTVSFDAADLYGGIQKTKNRIVGWFGRRNIERAAYSIADSEHTRNDVVRRFRVDPDRIRVVHLAADDHLFRPVPAERIAEVRQRLGLPDRFMFYVGGIDPRKNVSGLLRALSSFRGTDVDHVPLLMAGNIRSQAEFPELEALIRSERLEDRVQMLGFVDDATLAVLYATCSVFAFPSYYEGFGLPVLEAMASGAPVVTTRRSSIPELGGEAVLYVEPDSVSDIARGLRDVLLGHDLRVALKMAGPQRARLFSWDRTVRETMAVYARLLEGSSSSRI
ncbi:MAG: glycosyltransferase family 4 protein [Bacteroidetes bacterium]|jgi:glycosyltransferase involved in cell wall biosynthesis|nr:glycosyltransferase family 4 protein [Bacteroidota bacterium]